MNGDNYQRLRGVFDGALDQASSGKGYERHADGQPFERQEICENTRAVGLGFPLGQARKKIKESLRLLESRGQAAAVNELYGAINYVAAAIIVIEDSGQVVEKIGPPEMDRKNVLGWSLQRGKDGYIRAYRKIDGEVKSIYIGKVDAVSVTENKIMSKAVTEGWPVGERANPPETTRISCERHDCDHNRPGSWCGLDEGYPAIDPEGFCMEWRAKDAEAA